MKAIKLITFDATNTILKFKIPPWDHYALVARNYGFTGTGMDIKDQMLQSFKFMERKYPNFGKGDITWRVWWQKLIQLTFKDHLPPAADVTKMGTKLIEQYATTKCWNIAYGTPKLLEHFRDDGIALGVISNFDPRLNSILQNVLLRQYFDFVLTSYEVGYSKPSPKIFSRALEFCKTPTTASEALHIGDDYEKDFMAAKNCGWHSILLRNPPGEIMDIPSEDDCVFPSIQALSDAYEQKLIKLKNNIC